MIIKAVLSVFSLLFKIPIFKGLNKIGGMIFGLAKGMFIVYFISFLLKEMIVFFPNSQLEGILQSSAILTYLQTVDILKLLQDFKYRKYI